MCVTIIDPEKKGEWKSRQQQADEEDVDELCAEAEEEAKLKFYDFQSTLKADMQKDGLQTRSLSKSFALLLQQTAQKVWLEEDPTQPKQRS